jgi:D-aminopeptidase
MSPGQLNSITDVKGVRVGHATLISGEGALRIGHGPVRTGVTAILPHAGNTIREPVEASVSVFNGAGTTTGLSLIEEFGLIDTPICLTNTMSVGGVYDALARYVTENFIDGPDDRSWFSPVVGETDDSFLNDSHGFHVGREHVWHAIESASSETVAEGVVGAGTGISTCSFKSGIGTSSRRVELDGQTYTVGTLVQSNFLGSLVIDGVPVGKEIASRGEVNSPQNDGSLMVVLATDCPLNSRQLRRLAARGALGMARTGAKGGHSSGDYFIAFSVTCRSAGEKDRKALVESVRLEDENLMNPFLVASAEVVEEAILNSLLKAVTVVGRDGNTSRAIDLDEMIMVFRRHGRLV